MNIHKNARYRSGGAAQLRDRSSAPGCCKHRIAVERVSEITALRRQRMSGPAIGRQLGMSVSTVGAILRRLGLGKPGPLEAKPVVVLPGIRKSALAGDRRSTAPGALPAATGTSGENPETGRRDAQPNDRSRDPAGGPAAASAAIGPDIQRAQFRLPAGTLRPPGGGVGASLRHRECAGSLASYSRCWRSCHPAALLAGCRPHLAERLSEPERAIGGRNLRHSCQAATLQIEQQITPRL